MKFLNLIGEDPNREGLIKTPERVAKALQFLTHGYDLNPEELLTFSHVQRRLQANGHCERY